MTRAALYVRVSERDGRQHTENQRAELVAWAQRLGLEVVGLYEDMASGAKTEHERPALARLLRDAHHRRMDVVLIWALDRLSRSGIAATGTVLEKLKAAGVEVRSLQEAWLSTGGPVGELLVAVFAWLAKQERERLRERVRAGLERAKREGKPVGRPLVAVDILRVRLLLHQGHSIRAVGRIMGLAERTVRRNLRLFDGRNEDAGRAFVARSVLGS